jgi:hypothetical protein
MCWDAVVRRHAGWRYRSRKRVLMKDRVKSVDAKSQEEALGGGGRVEFIDIAGCVSRW